MPRSSLREERLKRCIRATHVEKNDSLPEWLEVLEYMLRSMADDVEKSKSSHLQHCQALWEGILSVSWGWHSKLLQTVWLNAMEMYSHSSGDQKSELKAGLCPFEGSFLAS